MDRFTAIIKYRPETIDLIVSSIKYNLKDENAMSLLGDILVNL